MTETLLAEPCYGCGQSGVELVDWVCIGCWGSDLKKARRKERSQEIRDFREEVGMPIHTENALKAKKYWLEQGVLKGETEETLKKRHEDARKTFEERLEPLKPKRQKRSAVSDNVVKAKAYWRSQGYDVK